MGFQEEKIDKSGVGTSLRCGSLSPPVAGTKMTLRCVVDVWHTGNHRALTGEEWENAGDVGG